MHLFFIILYCILAITSNSKLNPRISDIRNTPMKKILLKSKTSVQSTPGNMLKAVNSSKLSVEIPEEKKIKIIGRKKQDTNISLDKKTDESEINIIKAEELRRKMEDSMKTNESISRDFNATTENSKMSFKDFYARNIPRKIKEGNFDNKSTDKEIDQSKDTENQNQPQNVNSNVLGINKNESLNVSETNKSAINNSYQSLGRYSLRNQNSVLVTKELIDFNGVKDRLELLENEIKLRILKIFPNQQVENFSSSIFSKTYLNNDFRFQLLIMAKFFNLNHDEKSFEITKFTLKDASKIGSELYKFLTLRIIDLLSSYKDINETIKSKMQIILKEEEDHSIKYTFMISGSSNYAFFSCFQKMISYELVELENFVNKNTYLTLDDAFNLKKTISDGIYKEQLLPKIYQESKHSSIDNNIYLNHFNILLIYFDVKNGTSVLENELKKIYAKVNVENEVLSKNENFKNNSNKFSPLNEDIELSFTPYHRCGIFLKETQSDPHKNSLILKSTEKIETENRNNDNNQNNNSIISVDKIETEYLSRKLVRKDQEYNCSNSRDSISESHPVIEKKPQLCNNSDDDIMKTPSNDKFCVIDLDNISDEADYQKNYTDIQESNINYKNKKPFEDILKIDIINIGDKNIKQKIRNGDEIFENKTFLDGNDENTIKKPIFEGQKVFKNKSDTISKVTYTENSEMNYDDEKIEKINYKDNQDEKMNLSEFDCSDNDYFESDVKTKWEELKRFNRNQNKLSCDSDSDPLKFNSIKFH